MIVEWLLRLLGLTPRRERALARAAARGELLAQSRPEAERRAELARAMAAREGEPHVLLGTLDDGAPYRLPLADFEGLFSWVTGATGSGKTRLALAWLDQILRAMATGAPVSLLILDLKGELSDLILTLLGAETVRRPASGHLLEHLLTMRFFRGDAYLPPWNLLSPMPGLSAATQAHALAEALEHALGMGLGTRQEYAFAMVLALGIERALTLPELALALADPDALAVHARRSRSQELRVYFEHRYPREAPATRDGLTTRANLLLSIDSIRAMVSARATIDWRERLLPGRVSVLDFGGAPFGADGARRAVSSLALQLVLAGVFSPGTREGFCFIACDEVQDAITPATLRNLERILSTARSFQTGMLVVHQALTQLPSPFLQLLSTNVRVRAIGRAGGEDARLSREWAPRSVALRRPVTRVGERSEVLSHAEEERLFVAELGRLPRRRFLLADRTTPWGAQWITAPRIDIPTLSDLPSALRDRLERGAFGQPREALQLPAQVEEPASEPASDAAPEATPEPLPARRPRARRKGPKPEGDMPDLIEAAEDWGRGRRVH